MHVGGKERSSQRPPRPGPPAIHQTTRAFPTLLGWILPDHSLSKGGLVALQLYLLCPTQGSASAMGSVSVPYADTCP